MEDNHNPNHTSNNVTEKKSKLEFIPSEKKLEDFDEIYKNYPLTEDTTCGLGPLRGSLLQKFANKKAFVILYGLTGCIYGSSYSYFNGTITTLEKRFKIPSRVTGLITVGNDICQLFLSIAITYYAGKKHRPRMVAIGIGFVALYCLMNALPHFLWGAGEDAKSLTLEYGAVFDENTTLEVRARENEKKLCKRNREGGLECRDEAGDNLAWILLFIANFISGLGGSMYYALGTSYMDDNIKKEKTPVLISFSYFIRMLGPAFGYSLASYCLSVYVSPGLTPTITTLDPRWTGAWWIGWLVIGSILLLSSFTLALFPKTLPRAAVRKMIAQEKLKEHPNEGKEEDDQASFNDMIQAFKRIITNKTFLCNNFSSVFYFLGFVPFWFFMPKYIETQYRQSASLASLVTGTVGLVFAAIGLLVSGVVISKFKPRARYLAGWNVFVGALCCGVVILYMFIGCELNDEYSKMFSSGELSTSLSCNRDCNCEYVKYSPVCSEDLKTNFISACHAGCYEIGTSKGKKKMYHNCMCIAPTLNRTIIENNDTKDTEESILNLIGGNAIHGSCPVDCTKVFITFLVIGCVWKLVGSTGRASNFLVAIRCVEERDKSISMGFSVAFSSLCAFIPGPIFYGWIIDNTCLVWGKTCSGTGNCWVYDAKSMRYMLNTISAAFLVLGTVFDAFVWYYVKDLKIFDDEDTSKESDTKEENQKSEEKPLSP